MAPIRSDDPRSTPAVVRGERIGPPEENERKPNVEEAVPFPKGTELSPQSKVSGSGWKNTGPIGNEQVTALRAEFVKGRITPEQIQQLSVALSYDLFTNGRKLPPLMPRVWAPGTVSAERGSVTVSLRNVVSLSEGFFLKTGARTRLTAFGPVTGRDFDPHWQPPGQGPMLSTLYEASLWQRTDLGHGFALETASGAGFDVPVGPAAFGAARAWAQTGINNQNIRLEVGVQGTIPWVGDNNFALPLNKEVVISPYGQVTYSNRTIDVTVRAEGRALATNSAVFTLHFTYTF